jgi:Tfp pilus assembly protein PilE
MKLPSNISRARGRAGITLIECMTFIAVFLILSSIAMGAFYFFWDRSAALISATDDISAALNAGERWRADVRGATGTITVETLASGETVNIPEGESEVVYHFASGRMQRQIGSASFNPFQLTKILSSEMKSESRGGVKAWRWELQLAQRRKETYLPLLFTFEAAQKTP